MVRKDDEIVVKVKDTVTNVLGQEKEVEDDAGVDISVVSPSVLNRSEDVFGRDGKVVNIIGKDDVVDGV